MLLTGVLEIAAPATVVLAAMDRPEVLRALLPGEAEVRRTGAGLFSFTLRKSLGLVELRQGGTITVETADKGMQLTLRTRHRIGGAADVSLRIGLAEVAASATRIDYDGQVAATGLAARLLRDREAQVRPYIAKVFERLRAQIESAPRIKS